MKHLLLSIILTATVLLYAQDKPAAKLSGLMFGDYFYNVARDTGITSLKNKATNGMQDLNGFQLRRIYLTYDGEISSSITSRFRLEGTTGAPFVKDAYIKWKNIFTGADLIVGLQPTLAYEVSEGVWGYRSLEKTILDLRGIVSSRVLAVSLKGKVDEMVNYWVMLGNNSGTGAETDKYKRIYVGFGIKPTEKIQVTVHGDYKTASAINDPANTSTPKTTVNNNTLTASLFVGYTEKNMFRAGVEGFLQSNANGYSIAGPPISVKDKNAIGLSFFGTYVLSENMNLLGRYDYYDPNADGNAKGDSRNYIIAGLDYKADQKVSVIPNIQYETYESIGSRSIDASLTARITLFYTFL